MNISFFIAKRLMQGKSSKSGLIINIAIAAVAISIAVMLLAVAVVQGYQLQITNKITGFSNHIQITRLDFNNSFETNPIYRDSALESKIRLDERIKFIQPFGIKAGIIKTNNEFEGIILKGINPDFNWNFIKEHLVSGNVFFAGDSVLTNDIVISQNTAKKLGVETGQALIIYFIQEDGSLPRARKFKISGIYNTGFSDLDALYGIINIQHIQKLNRWIHSQVSGYEVNISDYKELNKINDELIETMPYHLQSKSIIQMYPQLFDWLALLDLNVLIIIILMVLVACINMSTALLILIVERSNMIGMLKAMGAKNKLVQRIFLYMAAWLIAIGLFIGNAIAGIIYLTQYYFEWIKLNQEDYFLSTVPMEISLQNILEINLGAFIVCLVVLFLPVRFVSKVTPVKAIRFQ